MYVQVQSRTRSSCRPPSGRYSAGSAANAAAAASSLQSTVPLCQQSYTQLRGRALPTANLRGIVPASFCTRSAAYSTHPATQCTHKAAGPDIALVCVCVHAIATAAVLLKSNHANVHNEFQCLCSLSCNPADRTSRPPQTLPLLPPGSCMLNTAAAAAVRSTLRCSCSPTACFILPHLQADHLQVCCCSSSTTWTTGPAPLQAKLAWLACCCCCLFISITGLQLPARLPPGAVRCVPA
jgi:hypothetical protein